MDNPKDLAWFWIIEDLAGNIHIPVSVLDELWNRVENPLSPRGRRARERLAFRHLIELFSDCSAIALGSGSKPRFAVSETCQSVLDCVRRELSTSSSRKSTLESYKWDVDQFILRKSVRWPKCALQQLKEGILGGRYPSLREESGLDGKRQSRRVGPNAAVARLGLNLHNVEIRAPRLDLTQPITDKGENASQESPRPNTEILEQRETQYLDEQSARVERQYDKSSLAHGIDPDAAMCRLGQNLNNAEILVPRLDFAQPISGKGKSASQESPLAIILHSTSSEILKRSEVLSLNVQSGLDREHQKDKRCLLHSVDPNAAMGRLGQNRSSVEIQAPPEPIADNGIIALVESPPRNNSNSTSSEVFKQREVQSLGELNHELRPNNETPATNEISTHSVDPNIALGRHGQNCNSVEIQAPPEPTSDNGIIALVESPPGNILNSTSSDVFKQREVESFGELNHELRLNNEAHTTNEISTHKAAENVNTTLQKDLPEVILLSGKRKSRTEEQEAGCLDGDEQHPKDKKRKECAGFGSMNQKMDLSVDTSPLREPRVDFFRSFDEEMSSVPEESNQDFQSEEWPESRLCIKCNGGGQLLTCCGRSCPIDVHETCLGCSGSFDSTGKFYCPFCSSVQANAVYEESMKQMLLAKEKARLARYHLRKFMNSKLSERLASEESVERMVADAKNFLQETRHNHDAKGSAECNNSLTEGTSLSSIIKRNDGSLSTGDGPQIDETTMARHSDVYSVDLPHNPSFPVNFHLGVSANSPCLDTHTFLNSREHVDIGTNEVAFAKGDVDLTERLSSPIDKSAVEFSSKAPCVDTEAILNCGEHTDSTCLETRTILNSREHVDIGTEEVVVADRNVDLPKGLSSPVDENAVVLSAEASYVDTEATLNGREHTDCGNDNTALGKAKVNLPCELPPLNKNLVIAESLYVDAEAVPNSTDYSDARSSLESKSPDAPALSSEAGPTSRSKLPAKRQEVLPRRNKWSALEEAKLREGVQKFATSDKKVSWKKILEFGSDVFLPRRSAVDLKEKWKRLGPQEKKQGNP